MDAWRRTVTMGEVSGVFRGRATVRCPHLWPEQENFLQPTLYEKVRFWRFPARIAKFNNVWWSFLIPIQSAIKITTWDCIWYDAVIFCLSKFQKKMGEFAVFIEHSKAKNVSAAPGPRWGLRPQAPIIGSRSARSPWLPLCQILNTPLGEAKFC